MNFAKKNIFFTEHIWVTTSDPIKHDETVFTQSFIADILQDPKYASKYVRSFVVQSI